MAEQNIKQAGVSRKKKIPVWVWILIGLAVFPLLLIILLVAVLLVIGIVSGSSEDGAKEAMNSQESTVRQEYVLEAQDTAVEIEEYVVEESVSAEGTKESEETATEETGKENSEEYEFDSLEAISEICGLKATVQTRVVYGLVDTINDSNPYDVEWDYGEDYNAYVDACDWSLVFDADYYMDTFPMLAALYHYDEDLLLVHFQTVGVHEGRQGSADFNVSAYATNADSELYDTFGRNFEGYYIYYMLNYETEKNVDTVNNSNGEPTFTQYTQIFTAMQLAELEEVNAYRAEIGVEPLTLDSELCAAANLRAYINAHDGYAAHDWSRENLSTVYEWINILGADTFSENTVTSYSLLSSAHTFADDYAKSEAHYNAMTDDRFVYTGMSNCYVGSTKTSQFDVFTGELDTPTHN